MTNKELKSSVDAYASYLVENNCEFMIIALPTDEKTNACSVIATTQNCAALIAATLEKSNDFLQLYLDAAELFAPGSTNAGTLSMN